MSTQSFPKILSLCVFLALFHFAIKAKTLLLDESDENTHVCLYAGDTLNIRLNSNPSTGYTWTNPASPANLELISSKSMPGTAGRTGAPGFQVFSFNATKPGESTLVLKYTRPFENNSTPAQMFRLFITVEARPALSQTGPPKA